MTVTGWGVDLRYRTFNVGNVGFSECQKNPPTLCSKRWAAWKLRKGRSPSEFSNGRNAAFEMLEIRKCRNVSGAWGGNNCTLQWQSSSVFFLKKQIEIFLSLQDLRLFLLNWNKWWRRFSRRRLLMMQKRAEGWGERIGQRIHLDETFDWWSRISQVRIIQSHFTTLNCWVETRTDTLSWEISQNRSTIHRVARELPRQIFIVPHLPGGTVQQFDVKLPSVLCLICCFSFRWKNDGEKLNRTSEIVLISHDFHCSIFTSRFLNTQQHRQHAVVSLCVSLAQNHQSIP